MARLAATGLACMRGGRLLFSELDLALDAGDAAIVAGPNGIGKSSLIRLLAGLLPAAAGTVTRSGAVALADETLALDREAPLSGALGFWARFDDGDPAAALGLMGIAHLADVPVRLLSTGQRKRAVLARTIAANAAIWLLDEPANGLDGDGRMALEQAIAGHRAGGGIVLAATHLPLAIPGATSIALGGASA